MITRITTSTRVAAEFIRKGEAVAFPTETVYGLGADIFNPKAVRKIFRAKGRPADNPLIVHIADGKQLSLLANEIPASAAKLVRAFFPGPLTIIVRKSRAVPRTVTAGLGTVGIRMPDEPLTRKFLQECKAPIAAPSANRSGSPSPTTWHAVRDDLDGRIACILRGKRTRHGVESTVVDCTVSPPAVLRTGAITVEQLRAVLPNIRIGSKTSSSHPKSPGSKYRHYAPRARVVLISDQKEVRSSRSSAYIGLIPNRTPVAFAHICRNLTDYAHALYHFFRQCDKKRITTIYCQRPGTAGLGRTITERIEKASARD